MNTVLFERPGPDQRSWLLGVLRQETVGGVLMLGAAVLAMVWANSPWAGNYVRIVTATFGPEALHLHLPLAVWAADFLLAFFFFLAGLELKHEIIHGSLSRPAQAVVPIVASVCGMVVPAAIFFFITRADPVARHGWGIPMATDIAFALAVLAILGRGLPLALRGFLLTLAVVDDLGAITVIAIFYSHGFHLKAFIGALACIAGFWLLQHRRVSGTWSIVLGYAPLAALAWYLTHESGIHATVAGVALALVTRVRTDPGEVHAPAALAEDALRPFVAGFALPVFAFTSAGVVLFEGGQGIGDLLASPVGSATAIGLLVGKPIGVVGGSWLVARFTRATLDPNLRWADVIAVGFLAAIGFTVSLLIAELAYADELTHLREAKIGIIGATACAAVISGLILIWRRKAMARLIAEEETPESVPR